LIVNICKFLLEIIKVAEAFGVIKISLRLPWSWKSLAACCSCGRLRPWIRYLLFGCGAEELIDL